MNQRQGLIVDCQQINISLDKKIKMLEQSTIYKLVNNINSQHKLLQSYNHSIIKTIEWLLGDFYKIEYHGDYKQIVINFEDINAAFKSPYFLGITMVSPWNSWSNAKDIEKEFNDLKEFIYFFNQRIRLQNKNPIRLLNFGQHTSGAYNLSDILREKANRLPKIKLAVVLLLSTPLNLLTNLRNTMPNSYYAGCSATKPNDWQKLADGKGEIVSFESIVDRLLIELKNSNPS